jgi:phosphoribosylanthranilate isomerase
MPTPPRARLKVCCIQSLNEAHLAIRYGADALGLVASMPTGPGTIPDDLIRDIASHIPPPIATFLLTCRQTPEAIVDHIHLTRCNTVQLCDLPTPFTADTYRHIAREAPGVRIVQVIHVQDDESLEEARHAAQAGVHALLLDSGRTRNLAPASLILGGTGQTHDWSLSARIVKDSPVPVFLAGGLTSANVADAIRAVRPFGVDLCNGVRTAGHLNEPKLAAFTRALWPT